MKNAHGMKEPTTSVETVYYPCSLGYVYAPIQQVKAWICSHWHIANRLHWVRDVTFDEDRSQVRTRVPPRAVATLRNLAISVLRLDGEYNIEATTDDYSMCPRLPVDLVLSIHQRL